MPYRPRIIPVLLLQNRALVKSIKFKNHRYIGDPINAVRIFNDLGADELAFIDIAATRENRLVSLDIVKNVGEEANMPFSVGGGIRSLEDIGAIIEKGAEKVILNTIAADDHCFITKSAYEFGSSTIVVCMDVKKNLLGRYQTWIKAGKKSTGLSPLAFAKIMEDSGAGELIIQSIEKDGTMDGYDIEMIRSVSEHITIPVTVLGGAGTFSDMRELLDSTVVNGLAAGSMFVYHGPRRAVLVNYPSQAELRSIFIA
jgi:imidazole glycerol-phosphate synthase subunit HisF